MFLFFFKQKTAYEMRISDWSSDVCSSDLRSSSEVAPSAFMAQVPSTVTAATTACSHLVPRRGPCATPPAPAYFGDSALIAMWLGGNPGWEIGRASCRERGWQDVSISVFAG